MKCWTSSETGQLDGRQEEGSQIGTFTDAMAFPYIRSRRLAIGRTSDSSHGVSRGVRTLSDSDMCLVTEVATWGKYLESAVTGKSIRGSRRKLLLLDFQMAATCLFLNNGGLQGWTMHPILNIATRPRLYLSNRGYCEPFGTWGTRSLAPP